MQTFYTVKDAKALSRKIISANPKLQLNDSFEKQLDQVFEELSSKYSDDAKFQLNQEMLEGIITSISEFTTSTDSSSNKSDKSSSSGKRKVKILHSVTEEDNSDDDAEIVGEVIAKDIYKTLIKKLHKAISHMMIGRQAKGHFFKSNEKLDDMLTDIEAIKSGNYYLID
jgi:hypothetical protein